MTTELKDWERHIYSWPGIACWCCAKVLRDDWAFLDLEHAEGAVSSGDRLVPCEACMQAATKEVRGDA